MSSAGNLETFLETHNLRWLGSTGVLKAGQGEDTKDLLDLEAADGDSSGDLLDLDAPALADDLVILDDSDDESDEDSSDDDEEDDGTDGEEEIEACLVEF